MRASQPASNARPLPGPGRFVVLGDAELLRIETQQHEQQRQSDDDETA